MTTGPACRGANTEDFYSPYRWAEAAKLCSGCPIKLECRLDFAHDPWAYAGGMTPNQRKAWRERSSEVKEQARRKALAEKEARRLEDGTARNPQRGVPMSKERLALIFHIFDTELCGTKTIADRVGVSKSAVQRHLRASGRKRTKEEEIFLAKQGGMSGGQVAVGEQNRAMVSKLLDEGYTPKETAELVGIGVTHVYFIRRKLRESQ